MKYKYIIHVNCIDKFLGKYKSLNCPDSAIWQLCIPNLLILNPNFLNPLKGGDNCRATYFQFCFDAQIAS